MNKAAVALILRDLSSVFATFQSDIHSWLRETSSHLNSGLMSLSHRWRLTIHFSHVSVIWRGSDGITAGKDEGLLWPLPHLSPFTLQPVGGGVRVKHWNLLKRFSKVINSCASAMFEVAHEENQPIFKIRVLHSYYSIYESVTDDNMDTLQIFRI